MKIFISWSGQRSKSVGLLLSSWLKCVLQHSRPWISDTDIDRGAIWFTELNKALEECINGVICLTKENLNRPWLLFEAGALAKGLNTSRVCTFLIDLQPGDISEPLSQFNHTLPTQDGLRKLVITLNSGMGDYSLPSDILERVFTTYWPQFDSEFKKIISSTDEVGLPARKPADVMDEILTAMRRIERRVLSIEHRQTEEDNQRQQDPIKLVNYSSSYNMLQEAIKRLDALSCINTNDLMSNSVSNSSSKVVGEVIA